MSNPEYKKSEPGKWASEGIRVAEFDEFKLLDYENFLKLSMILLAMDWPQYIVFRYNESDRVVAPFVVGLSSVGNPLVRGFQVEGESRGEKDTGWRVFQLLKMENLANHQVFFKADDFEFDRNYPWIYKVYKML